MRGSVEELQRIGIKLFAAEGTELSTREVVPVFHRWIQTQAIPDQLLIDVADYSHVPEGPGVLLVAHHGNYSLDRFGGRLGLSYNRKVPAEGSLSDRLLGVARSAIQAGKLLEADADLAGRLRFRADEIQVFANDRLLAPNDAETLAGFQSALRALCRAFFGNEDCTVTPEADPKERFSVYARAQRSGGLPTL